jgi:tRNA threonylcarbamoyladenosine biosynthesis protein TsaE
LVVALSLSLATLFMRQALAHPHVWIVAEVTLVMHDGSIEAMQVSWTFDDFYSSLILEEFDKDGDGALSEAELAVVAQNQQEEDLGSYNYFTYITLGDQPLKVESVQDFRAEFNQDLLRFTFTVPMPAKVDPAKTPFAFSLHDPEYYIDIEIDRKNPVQYTGTAPKACQTVVVEDQENPIYFGMVYPTLVQVYCNVS